METSFKIEDKNFDGAHQHNSTAACTTTKKLKDSANNIVYSWYYYINIPYIYIYIYYGIIRKNNYTYIKYWSTKYKNIHNKITI